ncbi:MAG: hypothetical protein COV52_09685 [Gammaproteobacteria bacterium CG11_big_fil_rev_8_21_14_0_20_46_22]|nr:MAG: hypothetical protein COV52_09685 [Gammaproteobacteria bacterium CG11_big_fil_rev_8_21_14_0_20_46_22]
MNKDSLDEKVRRAKATPFLLPKEVSLKKTLLPDNVWTYVFRHNQLGELGRLVILPHPNGQSQFVCEVSGDPDDPMTQKRRTILEPITRELIGKMENICGQGTGETQPYTLQKQHHLVKSEVMPCERCGAPTAMLIIAPDAMTADRLEDYARKMFSQVKELNVPTWVVGAEREVKVDGALAGEALIMKVWPERVEAKLMLSTELNFQLDGLMEKHCMK